MLPRVCERCAECTHIIGQQSFAPDALDIAQLEQRASPWTVKLAGSNGSDGDAGHVGKAP
jgi:hypothetical protein